METGMNFSDYYELTQLYTDYAAAIDAGNWDAWPGFFKDVGERPIRH